MQSKAEWFRQKADECEAMAERAKAPDIQETYRTLARQWRQLADQAEVVTKRTGE